MLARGRGRALSAGRTPFAPTQLTLAFGGKSLVSTIEIRDIARYAGQKISIQGWLYNLRESGKLLFPIFRDGTGLLQGVVAKSAVSPEVFERVKNLTQESSLRAEGQV